MDSNNNLYQFTLRSLNNFNLEDIVDIVDKKKGFDVDFLHDKGSIRFMSLRRLMISADAYGDLRKTLINFLGETLASQIFLYFGYCCGANDAQAVRIKINNPDIAILQGPILHGSEGIVLAQNQLLLSEDGQLQLMKGVWLNSYEAEQHLRTCGQSEESICWSLSGYATGFASNIYEKQLLCIETECAAKGAQSCTYEIRPLHKWPEEIMRQWQWLFRQDSLNIDKNLSNLLVEERKMHVQRQLLQECLVKLSGQDDSNILLNKLIYYSHRLLKAKFTALYSIEEQNSLIVKDSIGVDGIDPPILSSIQTMAQKTLTFGEPFLQADLKGSLWILAIPIHVNNCITNIMVSITGKKLDYKTIEPIRFITKFCTTTMEKALFKKKLADLEVIDEKLKKDRKSLEQEVSTLSSISEMEETFLNCILQGKGISVLVQELGKQTQTSIIVLDDNEKIIGSNIDNKRAKELVQQTTKQYTKGKKNCFTFRLLAGERELGKLLAIEKHSSIGQKEKKILEKGAKIISIELLKEKEAHINYRYNFFESLLSGNYSSSGVLLTQANKVGFRLDGTYRMVGLSLENADPASPNSNFFYHNVRTCIKSHSPNSKILLYQNQVIIFLSYVDKDWTEDELERLFTKLREYLIGPFPGKGLYAVAGRVCECSISLYPLAYREIKSCLSIMTSLKQKDQLVTIEKLGILSILFEVEQDKLINFVTSILGYLIDYDERTNSELVATIASYANNNFNIQSTARNAYISASTLKYRLAKIKDLGIDLEDPEIRLSLQLALKLTQYKKTML